MMTYEIVPVSVIEASTSPEPDDVSRVSIRIEAKAGSLGADVNHINFVVKTASRTSPTADRKAAMTTNAKSITPVAEEFRIWTLAFDSQRSATEAVFRAGPQTGASVSLKANQTATFILRDIEVIDQDGTTNLLIEEFGTEPGNTAKTIRKIYPALRIDRFTATPPVVNAGEPVTLAWATTAATRIVLAGPGANLDSTDTNQHDSTMVVTPQTSSEFTLTAHAGSFADVTQQVSVTVKDQVTAPKLVVGVVPAAQAPGAGGAVVQNNLTAASLTATGAVTAGSLQLKGDVSMEPQTEEAGTFTKPFTIHQFRIPSSAFTNGRAVADIGLRIDKFQPAIVGFFVTDGNATITTLLPVFRDGKFFIDCRVRGSTNFVINLTLLFIRSEFVAPNTFAFNPNG